MGILRWKWTFANGGALAATVDTDRGVETVTQEGRVLAEAPRGTRPEGHVVLVEPRRDPDRSDRPPIEAVVTFDPAQPICILRVDGHDVAPTEWPVREKPPLPPAPRPWANYAFLSIFVAGLFALGLVVVTRFRSESTTAFGQFTGTHRATNGRFIAHFPDELEAKPVVLPGSVSGVLLVDKQKALAIVIAATPADSAHEPWALQQQLRDEVLANVPKGADRFEETSRSDDLCVGNHGAVVSGYLAQKTEKHGRIWSCAFEHDGAGYFVLSMLPEPESTEATARARAIIDATELTHLAELGAVTGAPKPE